MLEASSSISDGLTPSALKCEAQRSTMVATCRTSAMARDFLMAYSLVWVRAFSKLDAAPAVPTMSD